GDDEVHAGTGNLLVFGAGEKVGVKSGANGAKFLLVTGKPLHEPVAWGGPIVMNTEAEIKTAFSEIEAGTFIRAKPAGLK
ncbi:MAG TPA: pirin-like C-terminal cupin domain-containing protein, partial [Candidatus Micrarchaeota archaeon]|nr:pirin-like C-terminal cupin domain-containing protein [Candidatus Micrarchaeota archaeon]